MKDVALRAGVSQSTVSFVLNGNDNMRISAETRRRVLKAVAELGYRPRGAGRPPKVTGTRVIGLMFDEVATSPFAAISIEGAQEEAWKAGVLSRSS
jgi:LacI family transcriptional regulator